MPFFLDERIKLSISSWKSRDYFVRVFVRLTISSTWVSSSFIVSKFCSDGYVCGSQYLCGQYAGIFAPLKRHGCNNLPPGICRMESTESHPSIELDDLTGNPDHGQCNTMQPCPGDARPRRHRQ